MLQNARSLHRFFHFLKPVTLTLIYSFTPSVQSSDNIHCAYHQPGVKNVYWGDLHTHSAYSLDAWGFGTIASPAEAYGFARGKKIALPDGSLAKLDRPLDFAAVTDHAEWFDLLYICSEPTNSNNPHCSTLTTKNNPETGIEVFREYVVPTVTGVTPEQTLLCQENPAQCNSAVLSQWQRIQQQTRDANRPCDFTAFVAFEWSASPAASHGHRNIIFANNNVTTEAIDYIRYPGLNQLFDQLESQCLPENDCDVISIPHNTNMGDGIGFDVETDSARTLAQRRKYERLVEIYQEKGNSECLPAFGQSDEEECHFEVRLSNHSRPGIRANYSEQAWEKMRSTYVRGLLLKGLASYKASGGNSLQLGIIGSTDNHTGTPGMVDENSWTGPVFGIGNFDRAMTRRDWNPGGLVAVWAEENTRQSIFAALKRREVYGTSGPRIRLNFSASVDKAELTCAAKTPGASISMGGDFSHSAGKPQFMVLALYDEVPLVRIEIIKGELRDGELVQSKTEVWNNNRGAMNVCEIWQDPDFDPSAPAYWYPRVTQAPTPRWSAVQCKKLGRCDDYPEAVQTIMEQAWGSPIWYLPTSP